MVCEGCEGPEPPEGAYGGRERDVSPPPAHRLPAPDAPDVPDAPEEPRATHGYRPLAQGPDDAASDTTDDEEEDIMDTASETTATPNNVPQIESMDQQITREVWTSQRQEDPIQMDNERAQQVMTAMANFVLPQTSIPEWAQSISEDQWKQQLKDKIEIFKTKR